ncbi:MAG TPA: valine--tRNA ligase [Pirellulales bacterium]|jgi:valyl-tRNA synthetase|nr:valine--tRNA ligase [Pirellulales bacterium]
MATELAAHELPKQYDHSQAQSRWYPFWLERGYFHSEPDPDRQPYTIVIPPPNVTGALHLGHALNNSLQDILIRWRRMQGYNALWMPGTDHAGIATQAVVERRLLEEEKKTRHDLGRAALVERIWRWKDEYETRILSQLQQLGCSCDWQRTRFTLDPQCVRAVRHTFFGMFKSGLIYRGTRLVNWDTLLQTAVSDDEVTHETVAGHFWHLRYPVIDPKPGEPAFVSIATTRPETMLGDTAVAVHPDPEQALAAAERALGEKLASASEKERAGLERELQQLVERRRALLPHLIQLRDMALAGRKVRLPLVNREIPLVADVWAKPELGSGCVKITPAHDPNDYEVARRQQLPMINILNPDGTLNENAGPYAALRIAKARERVVADLEAQGLVESVEDREIELAHSDRSKTPIEPYLADQWFVKMEDLSQSAMDAVTDGRVKIVPGRYARGYLDWLSEKRDWPVSRQLWWGHRIPIWYAPTASEADLKRAFAGRADVVWRRDDENEGWLICAQEVDLSEDAIPGHKIEQEVDVLDTWFSSALWPHSTLGWPEQTPELQYYYPTSTLVTNRDIMTLWVARMVLTGLFNVGDVPFREVYIHPKILDGYGEGMSKSKGNGVDPLDVIESVGADSLRFSLAYLTTETQDVRMPVEFECPHCHAHIEQTKKNRVLPRIECKKCGQPFSTQWATRPEDLALARGAVVSERFELGRNFCNKLWNAARFAIMNLEGYSPGLVVPDELAIEDRWMLSRLTTVTTQCTAALEEYRFGDAARVLYDFAWNEFCSFYLEMAKPRLQDPASRANAQRILAGALDVLLRLLHPMIPFLTEEVWQRLGQLAPTRGIDELEPAAESIMIAPWPEADEARADEEIESRFARFQELLAGLREVRSRQNIPPRTPIRFSVRSVDATRDLLAPLTPYFDAMAGAHATAWGPQVAAPPAAASFVAAGAEVFVDLAGHIDLEAEVARKKKELERLASAIAGKQRQLANENFVSRAPAAVIEKERAALAELEQLRATTEAALAAAEGSPGAK